MLETIKKIISEPYIPYDQYFSEYVMSMQDMSIDNELRFLVLNNVLDTSILDSEIHLELGELLNK